MLAQWDTRKNKKPRCDKFKISFYFKKKKVKVWIDVDVWYNGAVLKLTEEEKTCHPVDEGVLLRKNRKERNRERNSEGFVKVP